MDDIKVSSKDFHEHIEDCKTLMERASESGFEFKLMKGQYNQAEIVLWGSICSGTGRRPMPGKVQQLEQWPEPQEQSDLVSFLAFVNYLR